jgi:hypothetical protein
MSDFRVAPITIEIMIACHVSPNPANHIGLERWDAPAAVNALNYLIGADLVDEQLSSTKRGRAWIEMLCGTPLPIEKWVDPRGLQ